MCGLHPRSFFFHEVHGFRTLKSIFPKKRGESSLKIIKKRVANLIELTKKRDRLLLSLFVVNHTSLFYTFTHHFLVILGTVGEISGVLPNTTNI